MRYHNITKDDIRNGEGLRVVLWVSGCSHGCKECHNQVTWDPGQGLEFDDSAKEELFECLNKDYISGVTFSGGDPLHPANIEKTAALIQEIKQEFPEKTIWLYTGFQWDEIKENDFIASVDVVVDGKYIAEQHDAKLHWRGSRNQNVIDAAKSLEADKVILYCD